MVIVPESEATLARTGAARTAAQTMTSCGAVPDGFLPLPNALISASGVTATTTTDDGGCFTFTFPTQTTAHNSRTPFLLMMTARKSNSRQGTTTLKKAAKIIPGSKSSFLNNDSISISSTIAALLIEKQMQSGESNIDPDAVEEYVDLLQDQEDMQALEQQILSSAETEDGDLDGIDTSVLDTATNSLDKPMVWDAAVTGGPVSAAGGDVGISAHAVVFDDSESITSVIATLTPGAGAAISVTLAESNTANLFFATHTFPAVGSAADVSYAVAISATTSSGATGTYATASLSITQSGTGTNGGGDTAVCGNSTQETGEQCDDGNTVTETCTYGQTACTVCTANCQNAAGATSFCGDSTTVTANGEQCDDGNTVTETCTYGQTACTVCTANCQNAAGATSFCGDSTTDTANGEQCDDGNTVTETCTYGQTACTVCTANCQSTAGTTSYCGDNTVDAANGEQCDDGNTAPNDGCSATCIPEPFKIVTGADHSCKWTPNGAVKCWGLNNSGQLGDGSNDNSNTPVDVSGLSSSVTDIFAGTYHTCALLDTGGVKCWGKNNSGQLGDGSTDDRTTPVDVSGLTSGVADISGGRAHTCALLETGAAKCWGFNCYGQVGDGATDNRTTPVDVTGLSSGVTDISGGEYHTCAVVGGAAKCWGYNGYGQVGDGTTDMRSSPVDVSGLGSGVAHVTAGKYRACALLDTGAVKCWGYNNYGQLGDGSMDTRTSPVDVSGLSSGVTVISAGESHTCAVVGGAAKCWGNNVGGKIGDGTTDTRTTPVDVSGLSSGVTDISSGGYHSCAVVNFVFKCWGYNNQGQLGDGSNDNSTTPVNVVSN